MNQHHYFIKVASLGSLITSPSLDGPSGPIREAILADGRHQGPAPKRRPPPLSETKGRVDKEKDEDSSKPSTAVDEHGAGCKSAFGLAPQYSVIYGPTDILS